MSGYSFSLLLAAIANLLIGIFVFFKKREEVTARAFFMLTIVLSLWLMGCFGESISKYQNSAIFWDKILYTGVSLYPLAYFYFLFLILDLKRNKRVLAIFGVVSLFFLILNYSSLRFYFIRDVVRNFPFRFIATPSIFWPWLVVYVTGASIYGLILIFRVFRKATGYKRNQLKYLFIAYTVLPLGGGMYFFLPLLIKTPPIDASLVVIFSGIMAYAITRHHLMDIDVLIKKSLVFAGMFVFVFGVFVGISLLVSQLIGGGKVISLFTSAVLIAIGLLPIEIWLVNATNKYLFQKKYDYKQIIQAFIDEVITVLDLDRIVRSTLEILSKTIYPETASIFLYNQPQDKYETYSVIGTEDKRIVLDSSNKLIAYLKNSKDIAFSGQIDDRIQVDPDIQEEMQQLKAIICLPLVLRDDLLGFITLGKKKSDQEYSKDDLDVLRALARTESIAIANSQLLAEAAQSERRATIGTMAASIHHEVGNPLNVINTKIQLFLLKCKKGLTQEKSKEQIVQECESILNETISQTNRISEITKKLANFAKPGKEIKPELVDIPEQIDETLAVVGHELELERITTEKQIQPDLPKISADKRQIQQILFNLIKNAGQAIAKTGKITIKAYTVAGKVQIEITDTGEGIPQERIQRIFEPFFTTKGSREGTGLGLSIVRQLVWRNKGKISVQSKVGEGTAFILEFPA